MNIEDLRMMAHDADGMGHRYIQFNMRRSRPKNWDRVRVLGHVYGRCIGEVKRGVYLVDVRLDDVFNALNRYDAAEAALTKGPAK